MYSVVVFCGPAAVGKHTIGLGLQVELEKEGHRVRFLSNNAVIDLVTKVFPFESPIAYTQMVDFKRRMLFDFAQYSQECLFVTQVFAQDDRSHTDLFNEFISRCAKNNKKVLFVVLTAKKSTLLERAHLPQRSENRNVSAEKVCEFIETMDERLLIDYAGTFIGADVRSYNTDNQKAAEVIGQLKNLCMW